MNTDILVLYVIDRSGSMGGFEQATADGFNTFIKEQAGIDGNAYVTEILFDDQVEVPFTAWNARDLPEMTPLTGAADFHQRRQTNELPRNPYWVRGSTALVDATCIAIKGGEEWLKNNAWFDGKVLVTILTDGGENASSKFTRADLRALKEEKEAAGWSFIFQGAGDSWMQAQDLGFTHDQTFAPVASASGYSSSYAGSSLGATTLRTKGAVNYAAVRGVVENDIDSKDGTS